mmetsp:Transcript_41816/g.82577  ORF Transcript_41816/g.82577 Transcript_41816/m.82577 type:complete len:102 (-) Transcript_41816:411-716(-)
MIRSFQERFRRDREDPIREYDGSTAVLPSQWYVFLKAFYLKKRRGQTDRPYTDKRMADRHSASKKERTKERKNMCRPLTCITTCLLCTRSQCLPSRFYNEV